MQNGVKTGLAVAAATLTLVATSGCTRMRQHQGYYMDTQLTDAIQPGVDNRDSVQTALGDPSFTGQFGTGDWYYFSRMTRSFAFRQPRPSEQTVLHIRFDQAGNVAAVEKLGLDKVVAINPYGDKTPTLGRKRGFFEDLFGNIGAVGAATGGSGGDSGP